MPPTEAGPSPGAPSPARLIVDLGAIVANYRALAARAAPAATAAVVKADAYGLGAARVAPALARAGCASFFVAQLGEGVALRRALGPAPAIYVLNGLGSGEDGVFQANGLAPVLNDLGEIAAWSACARASGQRLAAILHFDTGMSRLGLGPAEASRLEAEPERVADLALDYVMSHLVVSEDADQPINAAQLAEFRARRAAWPLVRASLVNSSGIFLGPEYRFDLVRAGAALYGVNPLARRPNPQVGVVRLEAKILQIRAVDPPRSVGYGATFRVTRPTRIATVALGYADGFLRSLSNRGHAYCGDIRVPIVGRVSMDLLTLDVTPAPAARPGDWVELIGPHLPVDEVADAAGTNAYEVLVRLGPRPERVYVGDRAAP